MMMLPTIFQMLLLFSKLTRYSTLSTSLDIGYDYDTYPSIGNDIGQLAEIVGHGVAGKLQIKVGSSLAKYNRHYLHVIIVNSH